MENLNIGQRVSYTTTGRFPKKVAGVIEGFDDPWVVVKCDDGITRKTRPGPLTAI